MMDGVQHNNVVTKNSPFLSVLKKQHIITPSFCKLEHISSGALGWTQSKKVYF
jgi:hypothetical protein